MKIRIFFTFVLVAVISILNLSAQNSDKGFLTLKMGQVEKAKTIFKSCIAANTGDSKSLYGMGECFFETQKYDSAILYYSNGVTANPADAYNYIGWGKAILISGNVIEAETKFEMARKIGKKDANIYAAIARAYISGNNSYYNLCDNELVKARKINPKTSSILLVEGLSAIKRKNYNEAAGKFDQSLYYDSLNIESYLNIADIYASAAYKQPAINYLTLLSVKVPECYVAYRELGDVYFNMTKYTEAKTAYEKYLSFDSYSLEEKERYAYTLFFIKNYELALSVVKELSKNDPENYIFLRLISYMDFETGEHTKGLESFNKFFSKIPESKIISLDYEYYGKTLGALNMDSLAIISYSAAYKMDTNKLQCLDEMGKLSIKQKKYSDAITYYSKSISKKETPMPLDYFQLGRSYYLLANSLSQNIDTANFDSLAMVDAAKTADTMFTRVCLLSPNSYLGFIWRARANSLLDPESSLGLSKTYYEQTLTILLQNPAKYSKEIVEAYSYLGYYYYVNENKTTSQEYWVKILEIDPNNEKALAAVKDLSLK